MRGIPYPSQNEKLRVGCTCLVGAATPHNSQSRIKRYEDQGYNIQAYIHVQSKRIALPLSGGSPDYIFGIWYFHPMQTP
jgi:hypothetical protein